MQRRISLSDSNIPSGNTIPANIKRPHSRSQYRAIALIPEGEGIVAQYSAVPEIDPPVGPVGFYANYQTAPDGTTGYYIHRPKDMALPQRTAQAIAIGMPQQAEGNLYGWMAKPDVGDREAALRDRTLRPIAWKTEQRFVPLRTVPNPDNIPWRSPQVTEGEKNIINAWNQPVTQWRVQRPLDPNNPADVQAKRITDYVGQHPYYTDPQDPFYDPSLALSAKQAKARFSQELPGMADTMAKGASPIGLPAMMAEVNALDRGSPDQVGTVYRGGLEEASPEQIVRLNQTIAQTRPPTWVNDRAPEQLRATLISPMATAGQTGDRFRQELRETPAIATERVTYDFGGGPVGFDVAQGQPLSDVLKSAPQHLFEPKRNIVRLEDQGITPFLADQTALQEQLKRDYNRDVQALRDNRARAMAATVGMVGYAPSPQLNRLRELADDIHVRYSGVEEGVPEYHRPLRVVSSPEAIDAQLASANVKIAGRYYPLTPDVDDYDWKEAALYSDRPDLPPAARLTQGISGADAQEAVQSARRNLNQYEAGLTSRINRGEQPDPEWFDQAGDLHGEMTKAEDVLQAVTEYEAAPPVVVQ